MLTWKNNNKKQTRLVHESVGQALCKRAPAYIKQKGTYNIMVCIQTSNQIASWQKHGLLNSKETKEEPGFLNHLQSKPARTYILCKVNDICSLLSINSYAVLSISTINRIHSRSHIKIGLPYPKSNICLTSKLTCRETKTGVYLIASNSNS